MTLQTLEEFTNMSALIKRCYFSLFGCQHFEPNKLLTVRLGGRPGIFAGVFSGHGAGDKNSDPASATHALVDLILQTGDLVCNIAAAGCPQPDGRMIPV